MFRQHVLFLSLLAASSATQFDPRRVNDPVVPYGLQPLQWGAVSPRGWLREWALAARHGSSSPVAAAFATVKPAGHSVDGWRDGRPGFGGFWDEDSAYWIDGMTRLGLVLGDAELVARGGADVRAVIADPWRFHNTFPHDAVEGWVRSIYSRAMLAYHSGTDDTRVIPFLAAAFSNYTPADSTHVGQDQLHQGSRSMTQMEALLEAHAFGGPASLAALALALMGPAAANGGYGFLQALLSENCTRAMDPATPAATVTAILRAGSCEQHAHGVTFNEVAKLFAMGYSHSGNASHLAAAVAAYEMVQVRTLYLLTDLLTRDFSVFYLLATHSSTCSAGTCCRTASTPRTRTWTAWGPTWRRRRAMSRTSFTRRRGCFA